MTINKTKLKHDFHKYMHKVYIEENIFYMQHNIHSFSTYENINMLQKVSFKINKLESGWILESSQKMSNTNKLN